MAISQERKELPGIRWCQNTAKRLKLEVWAQRAPGLLYNIMHNNYIIPTDSSAQGRDTDAITIWQMLLTNDSQKKTKKNAK